MSKLTIALCGNPNSGKTTLFNRLTGANQKVGNWAGVTVERKEGRYVKNADVNIVDTPGVYSLSPYALDEQITVDYLLNGRPDVIINVVDATNLERNLLLTTQLLDLDIPVVIALNLKDEAEAKGIVISPEALSNKLKCKAFYLSAAKNVGIDELMKYCTLQTPQPNTPIALPPDIEKRLATETARLQDVERNKRFVALQQLGGFVEQRYAKISNIVNVARQMDEDPKRDKRRKLTESIDKIVLNKWLAFPIFFAVMAAIFYISIGSVGKWLTDLINVHLTSWLQTQAANLLATANSPSLTSLVCDGIIQGVMSVAGFVPQIMLLFGCIAVLEASGYMSRIAFITDRALNKVGLGGRSFVSMILGCGCSVPAIMSARTIKNVNERNATITLTPFTPCSAKLAVISFFTAKVLNGNAIFAISFYIVSILAIILGGLVLKALRRNKLDYNDAFVMELPSYRLPTAANILKQMWERGKSFLVKAGTVIFASSVVLWMLQSFNFKFEYVTAEQSMLASIGKVIAPLFIPLGFSDGGCGWQFSVSTLTGIVAKETVVTTLEILLPAGIAGGISKLGAYCFVVYNLLTAPCIATISASFTELGGFKQGVKTLAFQVATAYVITFAIYQIGLLFANFPQTTTIVTVIAVVATALTLATVYTVKRRKCNGDCKSCANCNPHQS